MTIEMIIVLALLVAAIVLWMTEKLPVDLVALMLMALLMITGIITAEESLAGFSNTATVTVAAMFILSAALFKAGALDIFGTILGRIEEKNFWLLAISIMVLIAVLSAFINNTAAVALFLSIILRISQESSICRGGGRRSRPSPRQKMLIPLSFTSMFQRNVYTDRYIDKYPR